MKIKLDNYGCFFIKVKKINEIYRAFYIKTSYIMKHKKKSMDKKFLVPNKLYVVIIDHKGVDFVADEPMSINDFEKALIEGSTEFYDFKDYKNSEELYKTMKASGLKKFYTKEWTEKQFTFIKKQLDDLKSS